MLKDFLEVYNTVQQYLDFEYHGGDALPECFYDDCHMHTSDGGKLINVPVKVLIGAEPPAAKGQTRQEQFISIDIAGPNMAYAKVKSANIPHYYTDYHSLVKDGGKWKIVSKLWATALDPYEDAFTSIEAQEAAVSKIHQALNFYFEGLYEADAEKILLPFAPDAKMFFTNEKGKLSAVPASSLREVLKNAVSPKEKNESHHDFIQHIEMSGPATAMVKLNCAFGPSFYTDYLFMAMENGEWKIVAKTTMAIAR